MQNQSPYSNSPIPEPSGYNRPGGGLSGANNSGMGAQSVLPEELKGFNGGAFLLSLFWSIAHSTWLGLLVLVPYVGIVMSFVLGFKGNEWAWQNRKWDSIEHFKATQKVWLMWGLGLVVVWVVLFILIFVVAGVSGNFR